MEEEKRKKETIPSWLLLLNTLCFACKILNNLSYSGITVYVVITIKSLDYDWYYVIGLALVHFLWSSLIHAVWLK